MRITEETRQELEAYYQRRIEMYCSSGHIVAGFATENHAGIALLADNREMAEQLAAIVSALGCHPAFVLPEIERLKSLVDELPSIDRFRQVESENEKLKTLLEQALVGEKVKPSPDEDL
jgi:hypothetical protein